MPCPVFGGVATPGMKKGFKGSGIRVKGVEVKPLESLNPRILFSNETLDAPSGHRRYLKIESGDGFPTGFEACCWKILQEEGNKQGPEYLTVGFLSPEFLRPVNNSVGQLE
jgi:hypothetical protein